MTKTNPEAELLAIMRADRLVQIDRAGRQETLDMGDMEDEQIRAAKARTAAAGADA
jgi:hypothetical protein